MFVTSYSPYSSLLFLSLSLSLLRSSPSFTDSLYPKFPHFPLLSTHIVSPIHFSFFSPLRFSSLLHLSLNQVPNSESVQGGPMYTVNMDGIIRTLRHRTLHSIAVDRFGNLSARIVELLQRKKWEHTFDIFEDIISQSVSCNDRWLSYSTFFSFLYSWLWSIPLISRFLEQQNIADLAIIPAREARERLYKLFKYVCYAMCLLILR